MACDTKKGFEVALNEALYSAFLNAIKMRVSSMYYKRSNRA
jgi:hypothetical protein